MVSVPITFWGVLLLFYFSFQYFGVVYNKTIISLRGYVMIIACSATRTSLAIYHIKSNARLAYMKPDRVNETTLMFRCMPLHGLQLLVQFIR